MLNPRFLRKVRTYTAGEVTWQRSYVAGYCTYLSVRWHSIEVQGGIVARFLFNFVWEFVGDGQKWHSIEGDIVKGWHIKEVCLYTQCRFYSK